VKSVDTNVLARFFIDDQDDAEAVRQRPAAVAVMAAPVLVTVTVLLELEWVMRGFYGLSRADSVRVLRALLGIEHVRIEDRESVSAAVDALERGMDFADALHLVRSAGADAFVTFDRRLQRRAADALPVPPVELLESPPA
jgi:predicted nucleic-acid-binding protein